MAKTKIGTKVLADMEARLLQMGDDYIDEPFESEIKYALTEYDIYELADYGCLKDVRALVPEDGSIPYMDFNKVMEICDDTGACFTCCCQSFIMSFLLSDWYVPLHALREMLMAADRVKLPDDIDPEDLWLWYFRDGIPEGMDIEHPDADSIIAAYRNR